MNLKASFVSFLKNRYTSLNEDLLQAKIADQLLSPFQVELTQLQIDQIKSEIKSYSTLRQWGVQKLTDQYLQRGLKQPNNFSVCMSYDFHINAAGHPELIEINTNASFLALGLEMYNFLNLPNIASHFTQVQLIEMFLSELSLTGAKNKSVAIIDDNPVRQHLYVEFLIYQQLLQKHEVTCEITDFKNIELIRQAGLIYNRYTDFYLEQPQSIDLKKLFNNSGNFSPNPYEYFLLADKQRQLDWNQQTDVEKPKSLLPAFDLGLSDRDDIWQRRKNLFIKPKNSFGSKQVYKAASISNRLFTEIFNSNFIAQQLSTPSEVEFVFENTPLKLKYDLRCFVYQDQLQLIIARLYQGQTTNLRTPGGGFAAVILKN